MSVGTIANARIAELLRQYADLSEIKGENAFRINAYRRAAEAIEHLPEPAAERAMAGTLTEVEGIGAGLAAAIDEIVRAGHYTPLDEILDEMPSTLLTLLGLPGVGPKTVGRLYHEAGITNLAQLEEAARNARLRSVKGFGARQEARILEGIAFLNRRSNRFSIGMALPLATRLAEELRMHLAGRVEIAGSVRRGCETVGNIDLLAEAERFDSVAQSLDALPSVVSVEQSASDQLRAESHAGIGLRVVVARPERFGSALLQWTGNRGHVDALMARAGGELPSADDEAVLYEALGLPWIDPALREGRGEIAATETGALPELIEVADLRGDLHLHSTWSDGHASIEELATAARSRGYEYLSISDHSGGLAIARGLDIERLRAQRREIERVNELIPEVRLLRAAEVEVHRDGSLDFPDEVLAELDLVVASLHSGLRQPKPDLMRRILGVLRNPHVDIVAHPTGRIIDRRPGADYDWDEVFEVARETGTVIEINGDPARLDLNEEHARLAAEAGVTLSIDSDAHQLAGLDNVDYGVLVARRAWVRRRSVINTRSLDELFAWLDRGA